MNARTITAVLLIASHPLMAKEVHVSAGAKGPGQGTTAQPYGKFSTAIKALQPGDHLIIKPGRYTEPFRIHQAKDLKITARTGTVILDGSDPLTELEWKQHQGKVYKAKLSTPVSQLFCDDIMMTAARWPNAHMTDPNFFNLKDSWRMLDKGSAFGRVVDARPDREAGKSLSKGHALFNQESLADTGVDMTGAVAIMNIGSWMTFASRITSHRAGKNTFEYDHEFKEAGTAGKLALALAPGERFGKMGQAYWHPHYYMIEGLQCLDSPGEYWYNKDDNYLYFYAPDGKSPASHNLRGKRRSHVLTLNRCENITIQGLDFFSGTFYLSKSSGCLIENGELRHPSYNEIQTGNLGYFPITSIGPSGSEKSVLNTVRNCRFSYFDGIGIQGSGVLLDNCLFHDFQYTCFGFAAAVKPGDGSTTNRCTIYRTGTSEGFRGGKVDSLIQYSRLYDYGSLQHDGAAFQSSSRGKNIYFRNWVHDNPKIAYRFDSGDNPEAANAFGQVIQNVAWNVDRGCQIKGDDHLICNNLFLGADLQLNTQKRWKSTNDRTVTANNIAEEITEHGVRLSNRTGKNIRAGLRDPENWDFRPKPDSDLLGKATPIGPELLPEAFPVEFLDLTAASSIRDIGPYQSNLPRYWIPGFQDRVATTPIPRNNGQQVPLNANLMFLEAYQIKHHRVYLGKNPDSLKLIANLKDLTSNIVIPKKLEPKTTYHWRVDAVDDTGTPRTGTVWSFETQ